MPELPTTPKGAATSRRILDAATGEFAERGIAGARIDRITAAARTNKAQVYGYFGSKDGLFDAVLARCVEGAQDAVPFDATDLPGYAVQVYDEHLRNPVITRLLTWARLERRSVGLMLSGRLADTKVQAVADAQAAGKVRPGDPADLLVLVLGMASSWAPTSSAYVATADEPDADHERRRELLRECVTRALGGPGPAGV